MRELLLPIFSKYIDNGISPRELSHLLMGIIFEIEVLNVALKRKQVQTIIDSEAAKKEVKEKINSDMEERISDLETIVVDLIDRSEGFEHRIAQIKNLM